MVTRETIFQALFALAPSADTFPTRSRRWQNWQNSLPHQTADIPKLPFLCQYEAFTETVEYKGERGLPPIRTWTVRWLVYAKIPDGQTAGVPDTKTSGSEVLNPLLDAIESALAPAPLDEGVQTLGGLVIDCRIEGEIVKIPGDQDPSGLCGAVVPIKILVQ